MTPAAKIQKTKNGNDVRNIPKGAQQDQKLESKAPRITLISRVTLSSR